MALNADVFHEATVAVGFHTEQWWYEKQHQSIPHAAVVRPYSVR